MKKHFVFDFDDTLANAVEHNQICFVKAFKIHFPNINAGVLRNLHTTLRGRSMEEIFQRALDDLRLSGVTASDLRIENEKLQEVGFKNITLFPHAKEFLESLKKHGKLLSLISNRQTGSLTRALENNRVKDLFTHVLSCFDLGIEKSNPKSILDLIQKYGEPKENYIYVGDSETDAQFARNAGIDYIIVDQYLNNQKFYYHLIESFAFGQN